MRRPYLSGPAALLLAATVAAELAAIALSWGLEPRWDTLLYGIYTVTLAGAGALVATRQPGNPIGWLFLGAALLNGLAADLAQGWGLRAATEGWPAGTFAEWVATVSWLPGGILLVLTFLLFPDGRLPHPAWGVAALGAGLGALLALPGWGLDPDTGAEFAGGRNPYAADRLPTDVAFAVGLALLLGALGASVVSMGFRTRRSRGVERQQMKLLAFAAAFTTLALTAVGTLWTAVPAIHLLAPPALMALPVATCVAILRYRLYDIDVVIGRTVVYGALTLLLGATYVACALILGVVTGRGSPWAAAGAAVVAAIAFRPLRDRLQAAVDRRFRRTRHDALSLVAAFLEDLRIGRAAPEDVEDVFREALDDDTIRVRFLLPESGLCVDRHGQPVADTGDGGCERWPVRHRETTIGWVVRETRAEDPRPLLPEVIEAGGLAVEIARLRVALRRQLEQVEASRRRILGVAEAERHRIERDLHDGAQQRLVSIGLGLRHAQHMLGPDIAPEAARALDGAVAEITVAIDELRELARGLRPAHLDAGLGPALRELARRSPIPVDVDAAVGRLSPDLEVAAYFTACEGVTNAVKHARAGRVAVSASRQDGRLVVRVADDGVGGADPRGGSGLTGLADRVSARGGTLRIDSGTGDGTMLTAEFPCGS